MTSTSLPDSQKVWRFAIDHDESWWPIGYVQGRENMERVKAGLEAVMTEEGRDQLIITEVPFYPAVDDLDQVIRWMRMESEDGWPEEGDIWRRSDDEIAEEIDRDLLHRQIEEAQRTDPRIERVPSAVELRGLESAPLVAINEYVDDVLQYNQPSDFPLPDAFVIAPVAPGQVTLDDRGL